MQQITRLYHFLQEIYGDQPALTSIEVDVKKQSGGVGGTSHLEITNIRVYTGDAQLLPNFEEVPYWNEILAAYPNLFQDCRTHQDYLDTVQELLERERVYLDYRFDWPDANEKFLSPLHFSSEEISQMASKGASEADVLDEEEE